MPPQKTANRKISRPAAERLSEYLLILEQHLRGGKETISSNELAEIYGNTASQVRQDLFHLDNTGRIRHGYHIKTLSKTIRKTLGLEKTTNIVIIGCGKLGSALAEHVPFSLYGMKLSGVFDNDPHIIGSVLGGIEVENVEDLVPALKERNVKIAALCVPPAAAQKTADLLVSSGRIRGILNYTQLRLKVPSDIVVRDSQIVCSFMQIAYFSNRS